MSQSMSDRVTKCTQVTLQQTLDLSPQSIPITFQGLQVLQSPDNVSNNLNNLPLTFTLTLGGRERVRARVRVRVRVRGVRLVM
jgi:hypothetical protein